MPTKKRYGSVQRELYDEFAAECLNTSGAPVPDEESQQMFVAWLDRKGRLSEFDEGLRSYSVGALVKGWRMDHAKFVDPEVTEKGQLNLFPYPWDEFGMVVSGGYISNGNATREHRVELVDQKRRAIEKKQRELEVEEQRSFFLEAGFDAGAETSAQAKRIVEGDSDCSTPRTAQDQHIGA